jgi:hypothetical protein
VRPLDIHFALRPRRRRPYLAVVLAAAALACWGIAGWTWLGYHADLDAWQAQREALQDSASDAAEPAPADDGARNRLQYLAALDASIGAPWNALFGAFEALPAEQVALLSLSADAQQRAVTLGVEARDADAMLAYMQAVSASAALAEVHLASHQLNTDDPLRPVGFSLTANWKPLASRPMLVPAAATAAIADAGRAP